MAEKKPVAFGVGIPTGTEGLMYPVPFVRDVSDNLEISLRAEALGYESVWGNDHITTQQYVAEDYDAPPNYFAVLPTLAAIAAVTKKLKVATALLVLPLRQPGIVAKELVTLDHLAQGRLKVGVGIGAYREEFDSLYGVAAKGKNRGEMLDESLEIMGRLFQGERVSYAGKYFDVDQLQSFPVPVSNPFPFYIGGNSPQGLARAAKYGAGWLPSGFTPEEMRARIGTLSGLLEKGGRSLREIDIAPQFSVALGKTHEEALKKYKASQQYRHMLSLASSTMQGLDMEDIASRDLIGTPDEVCQRIAEYLEAGVNSFPALLFTANTLDAFYEEMQWFAEEVMRHFEK